MYSVQPGMAWPARREPNTGAKTVDHTQRKRRRKPKPDSRENGVKPSNSFDLPLNPYRYPEVQIFRYRIVTSTRVVACRPYPLANRLPPSAHHQLEPTTIWPPGFLLWLRCGVCSLIDFVLGRILCLWMASATLHIDNRCCEMEIINTRRPSCLCDAR